MKDSINKKVIVVSSIDYLRSKSDPEESRFIWKYSITIKNNGTKAIQLLNRHWKIYNDSEMIDEVFGPGVVGLQPLILPKKSFDYESFCILDTPTGKMMGVFEMQTVECDHFKVDIPDIDLIAQGDASSGDPITYN